MSDVLTEIKVIQKLLKEGRGEEVVEIMKKYNLDVITLIQLLNPPNPGRDNKRCYNCKHTTKRTRGAVFCTIHQCKKPLLSRCEHFTFV